MAGVVRNVDSLSYNGLAASPTRLCSDNQARGEDQRTRDDSGDSGPWGNSPFARPFSKPRPVRGAERNPPPLVDERYRVVDGQSASGRLQPSRHSKGAT